MADIQNHLLPHELKSLESSPEFTIPTETSETSEMAPSTYPLLNQVEGMVSVPSYEALRFEIVTGDTWKDFNQKMNDLSCEGLKTFGELGLVDNKYFQFMVKNCPTDMASAGEELNVQFVYISKFDNMSNFAQSIRQLLELGFSLGECKKGDHTYIQKMVRRRLCRDDMPLRLFVDANGDFINIQKKNLIVIRDPKSGKPQVGKIVDIFHETVRVAFSSNHVQNVMLNRESVFANIKKNLQESVESRSYMDPNGHIMMLTKGLTVLAKDNGGRYYEASIVEIRKEGDIRVHYKEWSNENDETIPVSSSRIYCWECATAKFTEKKDSKKREFVKK